MTANVQYIIIMLVDYSMEAITTVALVRNIIYLNFLDSNSMVNYNLQVILKKVPSFSLDEAKIPMPTITITTVIKTITVKSIQVVIVVITIIIIIIIA